MGLWKEEHELPLLTFQSGNEEVTDMCWSPSNSTVFGNVTGDGRLEVWDVNTSTLKPVLTSQLENTKLSCLLFSEASPVLVCGGSNGVVNVFRLVGVDSMDTVETQAKKLEDAVLTNIIGAAE